MELKDQVAIVTGAGLGMGRAIAEKLASCGAAVAAADKTEKDLTDTVGIIEKAGGKVVPVVADISKLEDIQRMFDECEAKLSAPDILVACAGISRGSPITEITEEFFHMIYDVNAKGTLFCLKQAGLRLKDGGRIVAISSCSARYAEMNMAVYGSSKAAIQLMVEVAALEFAPRGITVNSVQPGLTETHTMLASASMAHRERAISRTPLNRLGKPGDIAEVVAFLASKNSQWITGQHILASGGCQSVY